tara:strand:+ start:17747 stop:18139 length:393 start_codon:yes stop_codon:yes gene_type:complete
MSATITSSGRVVKAGEVRTAGNSEVLNVRVAVDNGWGDRKKTDFFSLSIWGRQAQSLAPILQKGTFIVFTGEFSTRGYEYNGEKRVDLEVNIDRIELGPRSAAADDDRRAADTGAAQSKVADDLEDEIPF